MLMLETRVARGRVVSARDRHPERKSPESGIRYGFLPDRKTFEDFKFRPERYFTDRNAS